MGDERGDEMRSLSQSVDGRGLATARIGVGIAGLLIAVEVYATLLAINERDVIRAPMWETLPLATPGLAHMLLVVTACSALFLVVGLFTRPAGLGLCVALALSVMVEQQTYSNHLTLCAWCGLWLSVSRSDARWSLTARLHGHGRPVFADQILLMTQLTVVYTFTGILKLNERFLSGEVIQAHSWWDVPDIVAVAMAVGAVITELALAIGLWLSRIRGWVAAAGIALHLAIPLTMPELGTVAFSILTLSLYPLYWMGTAAVASDADRTPSGSAALRELEEAP